MKYSPCFYCHKEILPTDSKRMVGLDVPYVNLFFHTECLKLIPDLLSYLTKNRELVYNYRENMKISSRKPQKL